MFVEKNYILTASEVLNKLNVLLMKDGKKKTVRRKVNTALQNFIKFKNSDVNIKPDKYTCYLTGMIHQLKPHVETRQVRKGAKYYDVPFPIKENRKLLLALRWLARSVRKRPEPGLVNQLKAEFLDLTYRKGYSIRERKALQKKVSANIIYSHFRWK